MRRVKISLFAVFCILLLFFACKKEKNSLQNEQDKNLVALIKDPDLKVLSLLNSSGFQEQLLFGQNGSIDLDTYLTAMDYANEIENKLVSRYEFPDESSSPYIGTAISLYREELIKNDKKDEWRIKTIEEQLSVRRNTSAFKLKSRMAIDPVDVYGYSINYDLVQRGINTWTDILIARKCGGVLEFTTHAQMLFRNKHGIKKVTRGEFDYHNELMANLSRDFERKLLACEKKSGPPDPGGNGGSGGNPPKPVPPTVNQLKDQIKNKPFALIPNIPCDIIKKWIATAKFAVDQSTLNRLTQIENIMKPGNDNSYLTNIQKIDDAYSTVVNMDYFPITVILMPLVNGKVSTPEQFLEYIRKNINSFVNTNYSEFKPYVYSGVDDTKLWNSSNPKNAVVAIDIKGPDNGSVIVSNYNSTGWTFTTIYEPMYGEHPVSGNRDFGFTKNANGSYTFFTKGVDRLTSLDLTIVQNATGIPFSKADALWTSFQKGVADFVNMNGGNAGASKQEIYRPNWEQVKAVIDGKAPLSSLSTDCK